MAAGSRPADAPEQPRPRGRRAPRQARRLRRHRQGGPRLALLRRDGPHAADAQAGRDDARPVRPPGRRHADPRVGAARPHRQLQPGRRLGQLGGVPPPGGPRPDHVRPDDRRLLDLHRHPGHPPGHLRDVRRRRREEVRRHPRRDDHPHRRARRHGRRPAARRHDERRRRDLYRRRPARHRAPHRAPLPGRQGRHPGARPPARRRGPRRPHARSPSASSATPPSCCPQHARRGRARSTSSPTRPRAHDPLAYLPDRRRLRRHGRRTPRRTRPASPPRARESMARHVEAMVGFMDAGAEVFDYGNSIRGEAQLAGYERAFAFPGFVPAYIRPLFCEGKGPFRWAALSGEASDIAQDRQGDPRALPGERVPAPLDQDGRRARPLPGPARPHLLARLRRARQGRRALQRHGRRAASWPPRWSSAATTSTAAPSPPRTARPRPCSTAPTRSPTGRC